MSTIKKLADSKISRVIALSSGVVVVIVGGIYLVLKKITPPILAPAQVSQSCRGCITTDDNGETINLFIPSRITLELPLTFYSEDGVILRARKTIFGEVFGAVARPGYWVRSYEAVATGTAELIVPSRNKNIPDFHISLVVQ